MATLDLLKKKLRCAAAAIESSQPVQTSPLSDAQYSAGFDTFAHSSGQMAYHGFIIPQLSLLVESLLETRSSISILEVGPGPKSILGRLPGHLQRRISRYSAFEPNALFASRLEESLLSKSERDYQPLPCLETLPDIQRISFPLEDSGLGGHTGAKVDADKFDMVLFCHSMYGMKPKKEILKRALDLLREQSGEEMVVVFHRDGTLIFDGLVCHRSATFPTGIVHVRDDDEALNAFASFIAGFAIQDTVVQKQFRETLRSQGKAVAGQLMFSAPEAMVVFNSQATKLAALTASVPLLSGGEIGIKNREARMRFPAAVLRPTEVRQVQLCVRWALEHGLSLSIIGGSHSGNCSWSHVVSVDMSAFSDIHIVPSGTDDGSTSTPAPLVVVGAGCTSGEIIRTTMEAGCTVPLGSRPSVGAGLWLQGGIGHLSRLHGLASDAIVGAVIVSVASGQVMHIGCVPSQHRPSNSLRPKDDEEMLWMLKGAGTNIGVVISVTFQACAAPLHSYQNWVVPFNNPLEAQLKLREFDESIASKLPLQCSSDAYLFWEGGELNLGVTVFEVSSTEHAVQETTVSSETLTKTLGHGKPSKIIDSAGLFEAEMYMSGMHGGHAGGKTSSFKRCVFLKRISSAEVSRALIAAIESRPSPLCYLHLLHGGGAIRGVAADETAFGCRDWDFACVLTGVWPRDQDGSEIAEATIQWVYDMIDVMLPTSSGVYGADLGPDPRDADLATKAFGANLPRLARLKSVCDPGNVLAHACPLRTTPTYPRVIFLVTGESCAGKDYCADVWASTLPACSQNIRRVRVASISEAIKHEYAKATGADRKRLLWDRGYKEQHRQALTMFFSDRVQQQPSYPQDNFLKLVHDNAGVDVLFITGMRETAPVAAVSHLVPGTRVLEIRVQTSEKTRSFRGGNSESYHHERSPSGDDYDKKDAESGSDGNSRPNLLFDNELTGEESVKAFATQRLLPFFDGDLLRLASMVPRVVNFPRHGMDFQDVLKIAQQHGGLRTCTSLMQRLSSVDWTKVGAIACCESGGFVFASALALQVDLRLALIRKAGKLPPSTFEATKSSSHISSMTNGGLKAERIEVDRAAFSGVGSVVVVDDVLATGNTLGAVLSLLKKAGIDDADVSVMVVAEFPAHRGRELLCQLGFGRVNVQSLLVFEGS